MSLFEIIAKISFCLLIAALLGFIVGWLFAKLRKEEKLNQQYNKLYENYELKTSEIKQLQEELTLKDENILDLEQKFQSCEKERLSAQMDQTGCDKYEDQIEELRAENNMLISQIKEQKICEDENSLLKDEIKVLEEERDGLLAKIDECKSYQENYKALIAQVEALKGEKEKLRQAVEEGESERIFSPGTVNRSEMSSDALKKIKKDLLHLKSEVEKVKMQKRALKTKIKKLEKKVAQKQKALEQCQSQKSLAARKKRTGDSTQEERVHKNIKRDEEEIKSLSELIRDTLDDIKES
jgi:chromosome segregation ATPase